MAARLARPVDTSCPVRAICGRGASVEVTTSRHTVRARHVVVAVPLPTLTDIRFDPPLPAPPMAAATHLRFGKATKIVARIIGPAPRHRTSIGDQVLPLAWRTGNAAAAMCPAPAPGHGDLVAALARTLEIPTDALANFEAFTWHDHPWALGTYLAPTPSTLQKHGNGLQHGSVPVWLAAAERSSHPTSMEGALEAADTVVDAVLAAASPGSTSDLGAPPHRPLSPCATPIHGDE